MFKLAAVALVMLVTPAWADDVVMVAKPRTKPIEVLIMGADNLKIEPAANMPVIKHEQNPPEGKKGSLPDTVEQWWFTEPVTVIRTEQCFGASIN